VYSAALLRAERGGRAALEQVLHDAGEGRALRSVFQPIVDLQADRVVGFEALTRFTAVPSRAPDWWFAQAAAAGRLVELELLALEVALGSLGDLPARAYMAVNLSAPTVVSSRLRPLIDAVPADRIVVELTEHMPIVDVESIASALAVLRRRGVPVAVDDVGAGFTSLSHMVRLGPDLIKIDRSLVHNVDKDSAKRALFRALTRFVDDVGAHIVAEGIETAGELSVLRDLGVHYGQGYHLAAPAALRAHRRVDSAR
jgi:EAL domain-containing protein (putative c-di-GMP-specific phosphodiesterase class I)